MISSKQLMAEAGLTYRQVDYWSRCGYLQSAAEGQGSGSSRRFDEREIPVAILMLALSRADMLGSASGRGGSRHTRYLRPLLDHVRAHGLSGQHALDADYVTIDLDRIAALAMV